jgi:hypothetical protein
MHVHIPKPLHGWREFVGEVGIIVIGVLLALAADQVVERISWRKHVTEAKEDLRNELEGDLFNAQERVRMAPCVDRRLDQLDQIIDHPPAKPWTLLGEHGVTPIRVWSASGWDSAVAAGTVTHMRPRERADYAGVYSFVRRMQDLTFDEFAVATEFRMLERGGPLSEATQDRLRANIARVRGYNQVLALGGTQISTQIRSLGVELSPEERQELEKMACPMPADAIPGGAEGLR